MERYFVCDGYCAQPIVLLSQLLGPLTPAELFVDADFAMLHQHESSNYATALVQAMEDVEIEDLSPDEDTVQLRSELLMKVASLLRSQPRRRRLSHFPSLEKNHR